MYFSINAMNGFDNIYRLKKDGSWQEQNNYKLFDLSNDLLFSDIHLAQQWLNARNVVNINGREVNINRETLLFSDKNKYDFEILCHRIHKPKHIFTYTEFENAIANANDAYNNSLQVNFDGEILVRQLKDNEAPNSLYDFAVREETFMAGNGYAGHNNMDEFYEDLYHSLLDGWLWHLLTGRSIYQGEEYPEKSIKEITSEISDIYNKLL